jgi:hypothetical protein
MTDESGGSRDDSEDPEDVTPGEAAAAQERSFWETRRRYNELDDELDNEAGRRERRRLSKASRRMNLQVRIHRYTRSHDEEGPVRGDLQLPPLPDRDDDHAPD